MAVGLPAWALTKEVTVEYHVDIPNHTGHIVEHSEHYIVLEGVSRKYLIPWTAIAYLWIPKKKEVLQHG